MRFVTPEPLRRALLSACVCLPALLLAGASAARAQEEPDLIVDETRLGANVSIAWEFFPPDDCAVEEACIGAPGHRKILRFSTETANIGMGDLFLGDPISNPLFEFSACHGHFHFGEYADHQLLDGGGLPVTPGMKTGFCLVDTRRYLNEAWVPFGPAYSCAFQGLQRGWSDIYAAQLDCQWIDVTGVPQGTYDLQVTVNPLGILDESDLTNNSATVPVTVTEPTGISSRPDGRFTPGQVLQVDHDSANTLVTYDVTSCPAADYNLYFGAGANIASYEYAGAFCNLGNDGQESLPLPDPNPGEWSWFVIVGRIGSLEGAHGFDSTGNLRPITGVGMCAVTGTRVTVLCQ